MLYRGQEIWGLANIAHLQVTGYGAVGRLRGQVLAPIRVLPEVFIVTVASVVQDRATQVRVSGFCGVPLAVTVTVIVSVPLF